MDHHRLKRYLLIASLALLVGAGLFVRVRGLSKYHFSPDEALEGWISSQPGLAAVWRLAQREPHPPLRYVIMHYVMAGSQNPLLRRSFSFIPGAGLILVLFALGRRFRGNAAGLAMAALTAFGLGPVLVSEGTRVYALAAIFQSLALYCWLAHLDDRRPSRLFGFSLLSVAALLSVYVQALPIAAIFIVWAGLLAHRRAPAREWRNLALATAPLLAALVLIYFIHGDYFLRTARFANPVEDWIRPFFFTSPGECLASLWGLFRYFTLPPLAGPAMAGCAVGMVALWRRGRREVVVVFGLTLALNILATAVEKFPFGATRHSFHFFPFVALGVGAAAQAGWDWARRRMPGREAAVAVGGFGLLVAAVVTVVGLYSRSDYLRRYDGEGWKELPLLAHDYQDAMREVSLGFRPGDVIFASYQSVIYLEMETGGHWVQAGAGLGRFNYRGHDWFFVTRDGLASVWGMPPADEVRRTVDGVRKLRGAPPDARVWIVNLGWAGTVDWMKTDPWWSSRVERTIETPGVGIYLINP